MSYKLYDKHLASFFAVAQAGSFSAAAARLFVSRTALLQQINLMEKELGFPVFERHNKGVTLTEAGRYFYEEMKKLTETSQKILRRCREMVQNSTEYVRIGTLPNFQPVFLPKICRAFKAAYPHIQLQFMEFSLETYFTNFINDQFDITTEYMSGYLFEQPDYQFIKLAQDRHCCGVAPQHPLATQCRLTAQELRGQKILLYARGITRADDQLRDYLAVSEVECIDIRQYNSTLPLKCELEGLVLIYYSLYQSSFASLVTLPLDIDFPIEIGLGYKKESSAAVKKFITLAQELFT